MLEEQTLEDLMEGVLEISKIILAGYKFPLSQSFGPHYAK
jgi:hypothetical protein